MFLFTISLSSFVLLFCEVALGYELGRPHRPIKRVEILSANNGAAFAAGLSRSPHNASSIMLSTGTSRVFSKFSNQTYSVMPPSAAPGTGQAPTLRQSSTVTKPPDPFGTGVCFYAGYGLPNIGCDGPEVWTTIDGSTPLTASLLNDECVLWNSSCTGNKTSAIEGFFNTIRDELFFNSCFMDNTSEECRRLETADRLSEYQTIKDWMHTSACWSDFLEYDTWHQISPENVTAVKSCCEKCHMAAENVDVYFWPSPEADTSCLSIVGDTVNPPDHGGTTDQYNGVYWGCTAATPVSGSTFITTATITTMQSLSIKQTLIDPWGPQPCIETTRASSATIPTYASDATLRARGHSLILPHSVTNVTGLPLSTVVTAGFTFTSPSIYANFHGIGAYDLCGRKTISQTLLSFPPGGLSTIAGPLYNPTHKMSTKQFNFGDLPCPPQSVMKANWYKPQRGEPYRPLLAMPPQITDLDPAFARCTDGFFTGYDPPRALTPVSAIVPLTTTREPVAAQVTAIPSATREAGPERTGESDLGNAAETVPVDGHRPMQTPSAPEVLHAGGAKHGFLTSTANTQQSSVNIQQSAESLQGQSNAFGSQDAPSAQADGSKPIDATTRNKPASLASLNNNLQPGVDPSNSNPQPQGTGPQPHETSNTSPEQMSYFSGPQVPPNDHGDKSSPGSDSKSRGEAGAEHNSSPAAGDTVPSNLDLNALRTRVRPQDSPASLNEQNGKPAPTTIFQADHAIVASPSGVEFDDSVLSLHGPPTTVSGIAAIYNGGSAILADHIVHLPPPTSAFLATTTISGQEVRVLADGKGVSIAGEYMTPGGAPVMISATPAYVDEGNRIHVGDRAYQLPTPPAVPATTLRNGAIASPLSNGVSIYGTTVTAGAPAVKVSGTLMSFDRSHNLIFGGTAVALPAMTAVHAVAKVTIAGEVTTVAGQVVHPGQSTSMDRQVAQPISNGISIAGNTFLVSGARTDSSGAMGSLGATTLAVGTTSTPSLSGFSNPGVSTTPVGASSPSLKAATSIAAGSLLNSKLLGEDALQAASQYQLAILVAIVISSFQVWS